MAQDRGVRSSSIVAPVLLIALGGLVLLSREFPNFYPLPVVGKYWPLILIFACAGMFWDRSPRLRNPESPTAFPVGTTLGTVVFLLVLLALIWRGHTYASREWPSHSTMKSHKVESIFRKEAKSVRMSV